MTRRDHGPLRVFELTDEFDFDEARLLVWACATPRILEAKVQSQPEAMSAEKLSAAFQALSDESGPTTLPARTNGRDYDA